MFSDFLVSYRSFILKTTEFGCAVYLEVALILAGLYKIRTHSSRFDGAEMFISVKPGILFMGLRQTV